MLAYKSTIRNLNSVVTELENQTSAFNRSITITTKQNEGFTNGQLVYQSFTKHNISLSTQFSALVSLRTDFTLLNLYFLDQFRFYQDSNCRQRQCNKYRFTKGILLQLLYYDQSTQTNK